VIQETVLTGGLPKKGAVSPVLNEIDDKTNK